MTRADKLAARMADQVVAGSGMITKSAGVRQEWTGVFLPIAQAVVAMERLARENGKRIRKLTALQDAFLDAVTEGIPGAEKIAQRASQPRFEPFEATRDSSPAKANGHSFGGESTRAPVWHPER